MENIEMQSTIINGEMDMCQNIATSKNPVYEQAEEGTSGNEIATSATLITMLKFGPLTETMDSYESHPFAEIFPDATMEEYNR